MTPDYTHSPASAYLKLYSENNINFEHIKFVFAFSLHYSVISLKSFAQDDRDRSATVHVANQI